jgi:UDP-3-O-[3-hydroxymyristoyl] glucosamine N-acyltransferase
MTDAAHACTLAELARKTGTALQGDGSVAIVRVGTLEGAGEGAIAFLANPRYRSQLAGTRASAVIVAPQDAAATSLPRLVTPDPYGTFAAVARLLNPVSAAVPGIDASAKVHADARVAASASIGPFVVVGAGSVIGERVAIGAHGVIGERCEIGDDSLLHPRATLYAGTRVGPRAVIHSGAVLGADGFGMADVDGRWLRIPQSGGVRVGADCEIGANTTIDRGAIDDTIIEDDVKLDNQIQIGHNCVIGRHTAIAACVGIAGSTRVGANCRIGGAAMISGHLTIAPDSVISGATAIFGDIDRPGTYTGVFPALPYRDWQTVAAQLRRLNELRRRVAALARDLAALTVHSNRGDT